VAPGTGTARHNTVSANSIHSNGGLGIDLAASGLTTPDGVSANDPLDSDAGGNELLNFPVVTSISATADSTRVGVSYSGMPNELITVQIFSSSTCHATGYGEGEAFLGSDMLLTNGSGLGSKTITVPGVVSYGRFVTATAIETYENSSEFSACMQFVNTPSGSNVQVDLQDDGVEATLTFDNVTVPGITSLTVTGSCAALPGAFLAPDSLCYDITTSATFAGSVEVCFSYDEGSLAGSESNVRLIHYDATALPPAWIDITTSVDTDANRVCGETGTLSPFVIGIGSVTGVGPSAQPREFALRQNIPNPFNPTTAIGYDVPAGGADVTIGVYDVAGRLVRTLVDERRPAGSHRVTWDGRDASRQPVATGVYFCRMQAGSFVQTRKMVLLK
jgi:hypothetical protein